MHFSIRYFFLFFKKRLRHRKSELELVIHVSFMRSVTVAYWFTFILFMCSCLCLHECIPHMCSCLSRPWKIIRFLRTRIIGKNELPVAAGNWTRVLMKEQVVVLTVEPLLLSPSSYPCNFCVSVSHFCPHIDAGKVSQLNVWLFKENWLYLF